ncbi:MAG: hypothetical protein IPN54_10230 [Bacteroidetes bacterium]|nr:hypothetical protein [Bacteroidota bacterium]MBK9424488.1 hypothetical protein [Bacteroidota bacterium]
MKKLFSLILVTAMLSIGVASFVQAQNEPKPAETALLLLLLLKSHFTRL